MAVGGFNQRISLEGAEEIAGQLNKLAETAQQAFAQLRTSAESVTGLQRLSNDVARLRTAFGGLGGPLRQITSEVSKLAAVFGVSVGLGGGGLVAGMFALVRSSASATSEVGGLARQTGSTVEEMSGMTEALSQTGVETDTLQGAFRRLAVRVESDWPAIQKAVRESADRILEAYVSLARGASSLAQTETALRNVREDNANRAITDANALKAAELNLAEVLERQRNARGEESDPFVLQQIAARREALTLSEAQARVDEARIRVERGAEEAAQRENDARLARETAALNLSRLRREAIEAERNDIVRLTQFVSGLAAGSAAAGANINLTADNVIRGLIASVGPGVSALGQLEGGLVSVAQTSPNLRAVILRLADVFKNMKDETLKTAIGVQLFGREAGVSLVKALSQGSAAILAEEQRLRSLGLTVTTQDAEIARAFKRSQTQLTNTVESIRNKLFIAFGPTMTALLNSFRASLERNFGSIKQVADGVAKSVESFGLALINIINGTSFADFARSAEAARLDPNQIVAVGEWQTAIQQIITMVSGFAAGVKEAVVNVIIPAFRAVIAVLNEVAAAFNGLFGTKLTGTQIAIAAVILQLIGFFRLLLNLIGLGSAAWVAFRAAGALAFSLILRPLVFLAGALVGLVATITGLPVLIAAGIVAAVAAAIAAIVVFWDEIKAGAAAAWEFIRQKASDAWEGIKTLFSAETLSAVWEGIKTAAGAAWTFVLNGAQALPGLIASALSGLADILLGPFVRAARLIIAIWETVIDKIRTALRLNASAEASTASGEVGAGGGGGGGFARGGYTGNLAPWRIAGVVHGREHVQPAHVVAQPGVLTFLEMLRRSGGDLQATIGRFARGYSMGGLVDGLSASLARNFAVPGYAGGGFVEAAPALSSPRHFGTLDLALPGGERVTVLAAADQVETLTRAVRLAGISSAGRKASGYRGL